MADETKDATQKPQPQQAIVPAPPRQTLEPSSGRSVSFAPSTYEQAVKFSQMVASSDFAPKDFKDKPQNVFIAMQMGAEVGLAPMQAIQNIAVINGRPSVWGDAALAIVQAHSSYEWHKEFFEGEGTAKTAVFQIKRKGNEMHEVRFSVADAKQANLLGKQGPWSQYPNRMLQMRARGFGLRDKFADALRGLSLTEEAMDVPNDVVANLPAGATVVADDPEKGLREQADKLMVEAGFNQARRTALLGQHKGKINDLLAKLAGQAATSAQGEHRADEKQSQDAPAAAAEQARPAAVEQQPSPVRPAAAGSGDRKQDATNAHGSTAGSTNAHGLDISDADLPEGMFDHLQPEPTQPDKQSAAQPKTGGRNGFSF